MHIMHMQAEEFNFVFMPLYLYISYSSGFIGVLVFGFLPVNWSRPGLSETIMAMVCVLNTAGLTVMGLSTNIWVSYAVYSGFRATYHTVISLAT